jgi:hypothetical protein
MAGFGYSAHRDSDAQTTREEMTQDVPKRPRRHFSGPITIGVILLFGLVVFEAFRFATRASDPAPASLQFGAPARPVRVFALDVHQMSVDRAIHTINLSHADVVLLHRVPTSEVERIGRAVHMSRADEASSDVFYPAQNFEGPATPYGNAIYSRFRLYEGRSIPNRGGSFGVWAVAVIDDVKVMLACMELTDSSSQVLGGQDAASVREKELATYQRGYEELGKPPIIVAADGRVSAYGSPPPTITVLSLEMPATYRASR